jgi:hypothetical protein
VSNFENGVKRYIMGYAVVEVGFPVDWRDNPDISCYQCKFFSRSTGRCNLTQEISEYPNKYVGSKCPLEIKEIEND